MDMPRSAALALYGAAARLASPALWLAGRTEARGGPEGARARFGTGGPGDGRPRLWLHGASVGEVGAARPLWAAMPEGTAGVVTAHTPTGRDAAAGWAPSAALAPWDVPRALGRFCAGWSPAAYVATDSEIWPLRIRTLARAGVPVMAANARLSERSAAAWARWAPGAIRALLGAHALVCPQDEASAERFLALGLPRERLGPAEALKAAFVPPAPLPDADALEAALPRARTVLGASTHPGEEALVLDAYLRARERVPGLRLILAPRHPRRAGEVAALVRARGLRPVRRTEGAPEGLAHPDAVYLVDTLGELTALYGHAAMAFLGATTGGRAGHAPFEAVRMGCVLAHGPDVAAAAEAYARLAAARGALRVEGADALGEAFALAARPEALAAMAARAREALAGPAPVVPGLVAEAALRAIAARRAA